MDNSVSKSSYAVARVYAGDDIAEVVPRQKARELVTSGQYFFINHGKDVKKLTPLDPPKTQLNDRFGWMPPFGRYRSTALNEGRRGQFSIGYPVPYADEGHLAEPKARVINFVPERLITR